MIEKTLLERLRNNDPDLVFLDLREQGLNDDDVTALAIALRHNTCVVGIDLGNESSLPTLLGTRRDPVFHLRFMNTYRNRPYRRFVARRNRITATGVATLARCHQLQWLGLNGNPLGDTAIAALMDMPRLAVLQVDHCQLTIEAARCFCDFPMLRALDDVGNSYQQTCDYVESDLNSRINAHLERNKVDFLENTPGYDEALHQHYVAAAYKAASHGDVDRLRAVLPKLPKGVHTLENEETRETLLQAAACANRPEAVRFLLAHGAEVEVANCKQYTPLFYAAERGYTEVTRILLQHLANLRGEFTFNNETAVSIAYFKLCDRVFSLCRQLTKKISRGPGEAQLKALLSRHTPSIDTWQIFFCNGDETPWEQFGTDKTLRNTMTRLACNIIVELTQVYRESRILPSYDRTLKEIRDYQAIIQRFLRLEKIVSGEDVEATVSENHGDSHTFITEQLQPQEPPDFHAHFTLARNLRRLNKEIAEKGHDNIDWDDYPNFYIAQYRGIHYYTHHFTAAQRLLYQQTRHLNRAAGASGSYELAGGSAQDIHHVRESALRSAITELRQWQKELETTQDVQQWWGRCDRIFENLRDAVQMRWSNSMSGFLQDLRQPKGNPHTEQLAQLGNQQVPYFATSDNPRHALRYAYGLKPDDTSRPYLLAPDYDNDGIPRHSALGKIFVYLFTPAQLHAHDSDHVISLHASGRVDIGDRIISEFETKFAGGIDQACALLEEDTFAPPINGGQESKHCQLALEQYRKHRRAILDAVTPEERAIATQAFLEARISAHESNLLRLVRQAVFERGGHLIYRNEKGQYAQIPTDLKKVKALHRRAVSDAAPPPTPPAAETGHKRQRSEGKLQQFFGTATHEEEMTKRQKVESALKQ